METTITITHHTRERLAALQAAMRAETGGRAVTADAALNRALDRSDQLAAYLARHPTGAPDAQ